MSAHVIRVTVDVNGRSATSELEIEADADACDALDPEEMADALTDVTAKLLGLAVEVEPEMDLPPVFGGGEGQPS